MINLIFNDVSCKNIAVRLSGGPDSAIVYYAVCDFYKNMPDVKIYPYTMATPLRPYTLDKANAVIEFTAAATGKTCEKHYTIYHTRHNKQNSLETNSVEYVNGQEILENQLLNEVRIDIIYYGLSMNCQTTDLKKFIDTLQPVKSMKYQNVLLAKDATRDFCTSSRIAFIDPHYAFLPLIASDKTIVKSLYDYYGVTKTLYPLTWSCENDLQAESGDVHCGCCYFCLEREFAFGKL
jgi:hypothetical protein